MSALILISVPVKALHVLKSSKEILYLTSTSCVNSLITTYKYKCNAEWIVAGTCQSEQGWLIPKTKGLGALPQIISNKKPWQINARISFLRRRRPIQWLPVNTSATQYEQKQELIPKTKCFGALPQIISNKKPWQINARVSFLRRRRPTLPRL